MNIKKQRQEVYFVFESFANKINTIIFTKGKTNLFIDIPFKDDVALCIAIPYVHRLKHYRKTNKTYIKFTAYYNTYEYDWNYETCKLLLKLLNINNKAKKILKLGLKQLCLTNLIVE